MLQLACLQFCENTTVTSCHITMRRCAVFCVNRYRVHCLGHSLGGGVAALAAYLLRNTAELRSRLSQGERFYLLPACNIDMWHTLAGSCAAGVSNPKGAGALRTCIVQQAVTSLCTGATICARMHTLWRCQACLRACTRAAGIPLQNFLTAHLPPAALLHSLLYYASSSLLHCSVWCGCNWLWHTTHHDKRAGRSCQQLHAHTGTQRKCCCSLLHTTNMRPPRPMFLHSSCWTHMYKYLAPLRRDHLY
jgi:hypothetical protein